MKLKIEKTSTNVRIEATVDGAKKPSIVNLTPEQLRGLLAILQAANAAESLSFTLEV